MLGLNYFGFQALWSPWLALFMVLLITAYLLLIGPMRHRFQNAEPVSTLRKVSFVSGVVIYYIAQGSPLDLLAHLMFSAHMLSMSLAYIVAPPLVLLGLPAWMLRPLFHDTAFRKMTHYLTQPIVTLLLFNMLFSFYHMPNIHDYIMTNYTLHTIYLIVLLTTAFMMWWNVLCPIPEMDRLSELRKMGYIFANGVLLTPACALIIFADSSLYATFSEPHIWAKALGYCVPTNAAALLEQFKGPQFFNVMPPRDDQQLGGIIMKLIQESVYGFVLIYVFYKWYRRENPNDAVDSMPNGIKAN